MIRKFTDIRAAAMVVYAPPNNNSDLIVIHVDKNDLEINPDLPYSANMQSFRHIASTVVVDKIEVALPPNHSPKFYENGIFWVASIALIVSIASLIITWINNRKVRRRSINDDFWVRKVLFDAAINPLITLATTVHGELPGESSKDDELVRYAEKFSADLRLIAPKLRLAQPVDKELFEALDAQCNRLEDIVNEYAGGACADLKSKTLTGISDCAIEIVRALRAYQERLN